MKTLFERFWSKVRYSKGCWEWVAAKNSGYGVIGLGRKKLFRAHRLSFEMEYGRPVSAGLQLDHLCRNAACVNPLHLEEVTSQENTRRGTAPETNKARSEATVSCPSGHLYTDKTSRIRIDGYRVCRECLKLKQREYRKNKHERTA